MLVLKAKTAVFGNMFTTKEISVRSASYKLDPLIFFQLLKKPILQ